MKKVKILTLYIAAFSMLFSCNSEKKISNQDKGVAVGATAGGVAGGIIGNQAGHHTAAGAVIGAVIGGVAGGVIGHKMDKQAEEVKKIENAKVEKINDGEGLKVTFESGILFATNSAELQPSAQTSLTKFAKTLTDNPETDIVISGHTDNTGSDAINQPLSERRAASVRNFLISKGIAGSRMNSVGNGSNQPVASNDTPEGRQQNRRVEVVIVANQTMIKQAKEGTLKE